jgi:eukaryotic-like serine/threonine-protein kinase
VTTLEAGTRVTPSIRLVRKLGEGGMGSVWVAFHDKLETEVAVKFVSHEFAQYTELRQRFSREASAAAKIKSPHIVQVFDHGELEELPYIVMELLVGEDLFSMLERERQVAIKDLLPILQQVCKGLAKAHQVGIVHRDIKPANIFLCEADDEVFAKVLDFGIAKSEGGVSHIKTQVGSVLGTPSYMSPEQVRSPRGVDLRADLWSLAVVVYEALSGQMPYSGETLGAVQIAIASSDYEPISKHCPWLPLTVDDWFAKAFNRDKDRRQASAKEFFDTLVEACPPAIRSIVPKQTKPTQDFPLVTVAPLLEAGAFGEASELFRPLSQTSEAADERVAGGMPDSREISLAFDAATDSPPVDPEDLKLTNVPRSRSNAGLEPAAGVGAISIALTPELDAPVPSTATPKSRTQSASEGAPPSIAGGSPSGSSRTTVLGIAIAAALAAGGAIYALTRPASGPTDTPISPVTPTKVIAVPAPTETALELVKVPHDPTSTTVGATGNLAPTAATTRGPLPHATVSGKLPPLTTTAAPTATARPTATVRDMGF